MVHYNNPTNNTTTYYSSLAWMALNDSGWPHQYVLPINAPLPSCDDDYYITAVQQEETDQ